jgi:hypothetical protein
MKRWYIISNRNLFPKLPLVVAQINSVKLAMLTKRISNFYSLQIYNNYTRSWTSYENLNNEELKQQLNLLDPTASIIEAENVQTVEDFQLEL